MTNNVESVSMGIPSSTSPLLQMFYHNVYKRKTASHLGCIGPTTNYGSGNAK